MVEQSIEKTNLSEYAVLPKTRPYIIADDRERDVIAELGTHPADVIAQRLDVADIICS